MQLERWAVYSTPLTTLAAGQVIKKQGIRMDAWPGPFVLRGVASMPANDDLTFQLYRPDGNYFQSAPVAAANIQTGAAVPRPHPISPATLYPHNVILAWDAIAGATPITAPGYCLAFWGAHLVEAPSTINPYPDSYREFSYELRVEVTVAANGVVRMPVRLPFVAPYVIRSLMYNMLDGAVPSDVRVQLRDANGVGYMNVPTNLQLVFQRSAAPWLATPNPELFIPAWGSYQLEVSELAGEGPFTIEFVFGGAALYV